MKCPALQRNELHRNDQARPVRHARQSPRARRFRPTRRLTIRALAAGTLIAALAPVTTTTAGASERSAPSPAISWTGCGTQQECARVSVPLDWAQRGGRTITLSVIRHLASHPGQRIGSLFVNPGGPGDSGVAAVAEQGGALDAMTGGRFDIVGWDPRGSGGSTPVSCFASSADREAFWQGMPLPTTRQDEQRYLAKSVALAQRCGVRNSPARQNAQQWPQVVQRLERVSRIGGPVMGWLHAACAAWPTRSADRYTGPWTVTTANPILLIGTRFDPTTPLANAKLAERRLGNAVLLTHDGYGHVSQADPSTCVMQALGRYFTGLSTPARGTICPSDHGPFDPGFGQPAASR